MYKDSRSIASSRASRKGFSVGFSGAVGECCGGRCGVGSGAVEEDTLFAVPNLAPLEWAGARLPGPGFVNVVISSSPRASVRSTLRRRSPP